MPSTLQGVIQKMRQSEPLDGEVIAELDRTLNALRDHGWSGSIAADEAVRTLGLVESEEPSIEFIGFHDQMYQGALRFECDGQRATAMFRRGDVTNVALFLNAEAIALLPREIAMKWDGRENDDPTAR